MSGSKSSAPEAVPAEPLGLTVHSLPQPTLPATQQVRIGRLKMLFVLLVCAAPVLASYFTYYVIRPGGKGTAYGTLIQPTRSLPGLPATTLDGQPRPLSALKGQWLLVVVGPADCPQACERRLFLQRQLREMLGRERDRLDKVWLITDTAPLRPQLRSALEATPAMHLLRLPQEVVAAWLQPAAGHALDDHVYLIDPMGEWMMRMPVDPEPARVKRDLDRLLRAAASWDTAGR